MSVLSCNRKGCDNIMCDRLSSEYGYICYECFEELSHIPLIEIDKFMSEEKLTHGNAIKQAWYRVIDDEFKQTP